MKFKSYILVLFMIIVNLGFSQTQKQIIEVGDDSFSTGDYLGASIYYKQALNYDSTDINLIFKYANALRKTSNYSKAEFYYKKLYKKDGGRTLPKAVYWLATMQKYNQKYLESYIIKFSVDIFDNINFSNLDLYSLK